jgi:hypothetical protein
MDVNDEPYRSAMKCGSYVDVFLSEDRLANFAEHERRAREVVRRVREAEEILARAEIVVRRAWFGEEDGFYWTLYVTGYGADIVEAREQWSRGVKCVAAAL